MKAVESKQPSAIAALCPNCALCCNGVLFADVRLQAGDDAEHLSTLGIELRRRKTVVRFRQPCACLEGKACQIYSERPVRCRTFECGLLQRVQKGAITESAALKVIRMAHRSAENVRRILRELGDTNEHLPLSRRYQRIMREAVDLSADERHIDLRGELMLAVAELVGNLERNFLSS